MNLANRKEVAHYKMLFIKDELVSENILLYIPFYITHFLNIFLNIVNLGIRLTLTENGRTPVNLKIM